MGRLPLARQKILDAATRIVMEQGAASLTYEQLVEESGVTRGGITYHFPTKHSLLAALVEEDLRRWNENEAALRPTDADDTTADLIAFVRAHTSKSADERRFVTGLLTAAAHDPSILDPIRDHEQTRIEDIEWDDAALMLQMLRFAAVGLFWSELFGCMELPGNVRERFVARLEQLAREWSDGPMDDVAPTATRASNDDSI